VKRNNALSFKSQACGECRRVFNLDGDGMGGCAECGGMLFRLTPTAYVTIRLEANKRHKAGLPLDGQIRVPASVPWPPA